jgi:hypothetical protein
MRFQVPTALHQQLEKKAKAEGWTIEEAMVRAIEHLVMEDQIYEMVATEVLARARARAVVLFDKPKLQRDIDTTVKAGYWAGVNDQDRAQRQEAPKPTEPSEHLIPVEAWKASEEGWDPNAEPWE